MRMIRSSLGVGLLGVLALAGPLVAAGPDGGGAPLPPATEQHTSTAPDGPQLFATHCRICHQAPKLAERIRNAPDQAAAAGKMTAFLSHHGRTDTEADALIVEFLADLASDQQP